MSMIYFCCFSGYYLVILNKLVLDLVLTCLFKGLEKMIKNELSRIYNINIIIDYS